jgi:Dolichyl-phosphate-mannose-protein mannosyltransferase
VTLNKTKRSEQRACELALDVTGSALTFGLIPQVLHLLFWASGISLLLWSWFDSQFRDAEGFLKGNFCLPMTAGVALLVIAWAGNGRLKNFALWFGLALVGQAVALQMVEAGPMLHYQHYKPFSRLVSGTDLLLLMFFLAQATFVAAGVISHWPTIRAWIGRTFKGWQVLGVGVIIFATSATVSRDIIFYLAELVFAVFVQAVNLGNIVLMAWALPDEALLRFKPKFDRWFGQPVDDDTESEIQNPRSEIENRASAIENLKSKIQNSGVDRFAALGAVWVTVLAAALNLFVYQNHPHIEDEVIYLYHARYLAEGVLTVPAPPVPEAFSLYLIPYAAARWYSIFPPGWPAILAIGILFGVPWLVNPVLAGVNVLLSYVFLREIYSRRLARMAVLLLCASPWFVFMGMNFMSHTLTLTCALTAAIAMARAKRSGGLVWAGVSGCATGMISLIRPIEGVVVAGLLGLWAIIPKVRLTVTALATFGLGTILVGALILPYNSRITGDPTVFPLVAYYEKYFGPKANAFGFGPERGLGWPIDPFPGHSPLDALVNANLNASSVNVELFGWSTGSWVLIAVILLSLTLRRNDYLMIATIVAIVGALSLYWFSGGPDFGARYWYLMIVPLVALTVRGAEFLEKSLEPGSVDSYNTHHGARMVAALLSLCVITFISYFPWRALDKYHHYLGMRPGIYSLARENRIGKSLVLVRGERHPDYASTAVYNPLDPYADAPIYAWDQNPKVRARLLQAYPDRPVWIVNGPTITRAGYQVLAGPLSAKDLGTGTLPLPIKAYR